MRAGSSLAYQLRPNKAVDRELFLMLLGRVAGIIGIERYRYIGLGGPFLEDFRLLHARLGISDMVCLETEPEVHLRQSFNRPINTIHCLHSSIEDYLRETEFDKQVILWLDYTSPSELREKIECFCDQVCLMPVGSIVKITLNANPGGCLGAPKEGEVGPPNVFGHSSGERQTLQDWRLARLKEKLAEFVPTSLSPDHLKNENFPSTLLEVLAFALDRKIEGYQDRKVIWCLATIYADGQTIVTATAFIAPSQGDEVEDVLKNWSFFSAPTNAHVLDMPTLSARERLQLEQSADLKSCLNYKLPESDLKKDPLETFKSFYRVYPYFARVDI